MAGDGGPVGQEGSAGRFVRSATWVVAVVWAAFFALVFALGITDGDADLVTKLLGLTMVVALGAAPVLVHRRVWPRGRDDAQPPALWQVPAYPVHSPLGRLERIAEAADQLRDRGAIPDGDHAAIGQRIQRLWDLTLADHRSLQLGGTASPVVMHEIEQLHARVVGLLDAAIDTAAVAPGDSDLDARLQSHLDRLHSRQQAVGELERPATWPTERPTAMPDHGRPQPGTG